MAKEPTERGAVPAEAEAPKADAPVERRLKCSISNIWTTKGKIFFEEEISLPIAEADALEKQMREISSRIMTEKMKARKKS